MEFKDKAALVTGSTSGIGKEIAKSLLKEGANVVINYSSNEANAEKTKEELKKYESQILLVKADVSSEEEVIDMMNQIKQKYGKLDYLINNAGTNVDSFIESFKLEDFQKVLKTNIVGVFLSTKYAIPLLKDGSNASIINIGSKLAIKPCAESSAYCLSKAAVLNFTKASALEFSEFKIRVNSVSPGFTPTPLSLAGWTEDEIKQKEKTNPMKRLGEAKDTANTVMFLLSEKAEYINGENINVNGGSLLI